MGSDDGTEQTMEQEADARAARTRRIATAVVLVIAAIGAIIHQLGPSVQLNGWAIRSFEWRLWDWYVEDAAISFAYARNWAEGDGLVAFPGGERIEGYSNPTWVALMTLFHLVGIDGWWSSKLMAIVFSVGSLVLMWKLTEDVIDDDTSWAPQIAPIILAASPTFAFYNAAGLENPLFTFLLAGGMWRTVVEGRRGGFPWAAVWYLLLACTRPDGIMYAALGGFVWMVLSVGNGRGIKPTLVWLLAFFGPFLAYQLVRYSYFSWVFPNTYYAKLGVRNWAPFHWGAGWKYIRGFGADTGLGWFAPLMMAGLVGLRGARWVWVVIGTVVYAAAFLYPAAEITKAWEWWPAGLPEPDGWNEIRVWALFAGAMMLMVASLRDRRAAGRILAFGSVLITLVFVVRARGDWMNGYRWLSMAQVPLVLLLATGIDEVAGLLQRLYSREASPSWTTPGWLGATLLTLGLLPGFFSHSDHLFGKREIGPHSVKRRVDYTAFLGDRLWQYDVPIHNLDVDMGAHLWWTKHRMVDMAGLVDIPVAMHTWQQRVFAEQYVYQQHPPFFAHLHGGWASKSRLTTYPVWEKGWVELPGYPVSRRTFHTGNHVRRNLILVDAYPGTPGRTVRFEGGIRLEGVDVPSPETAPGGGLYVEVGVSYRQPDDKQDFRLFVTLSNGAGAVHMVDVPNGYDWIPPTEWRMDEVFHGRFGFPLPDDLPAGTYDLGVVFLDADGLPVPLERDEETGVPLQLADGAIWADGDAVPAHVVRGEVRFPAMVTIGTVGEDVKAAHADREAAIAHAVAGRCEDAAAAWALARFHLPEARAWWEENRPGAEVSGCFAARAEANPDRIAASWDMDQARVWDFRAPAYVAAAHTVSADLWEQGEAASATGDWTAAYEAYEAAVRARPWFAWGRRAAEKARDRALGLAEDEDDAAKTKAKVAAAARAAANAAKRQKAADDAQ